MKMIHERLHTQVGYLQKMWSVDVVFRLIRVAFAIPLAAVAYIQIWTETEGFMRTFMLVALTPWITSVAYFEFKGIRKSTQRNLARLTNTDAKGSGNKENGNRDGALDSQAYPATEAAYSLVLPSYQWMLSRYEAADSRLQAFAAFISAFGFAALVFIRSITDSPDYGSPWFFSALGALSLALMVALVGRLRGSITLANPMTVWEEYLDVQPDEFMRDQLHWAGVHFNNNQQVIRAKFYSGMAAVLLFLVGTALLTVWGLSEAAGAVGGS